MTINGLHHVAIIASDYVRSRHFYSEILGFRIVAENYRSDRASHKLDLEVAGGVQIELFTFPDAPARLSRPEALGLRHLAFRVGDLDAAIGRLNQHAVEVETVRVDPYTGKRFTFFSDPDGLPLELYET
jgi:glyoxylase I family protein